MVFILELILNTCSTIGICTIMYVIANQSITRFVVVVWGITGASIRILLYAYENRTKLFKEKSDEQESSKKENNNQNSKEKSTENCKS